MNACRTMGRWCTTCGRDPATVPNGSLAPGRCRSANCNDGSETSRKASLWSSTGPHPVTAALAIRYGLDGRVLSGGLFAWKAAGLPVEGAGWD